MPTFSSCRNQSFGLQGKYTASIKGMLTLNGLSKQTNKKNNIALQYCTTICSVLFYLTSEFLSAQQTKLGKTLAVECQQLMLILR